MDLGSILAILALSLVVVAYVVRPLVEEEGFAVSSEGRKLSALEAEREQVLNVLQEMDLDHAMGKIAEDEYRRLRARAVSRGAEVLKEIDALRGLDPPEGASPEPQAEAEGGADLEARIERAVASRRRYAAYCNQCGQARLPGDAFCTRCGAKVAEGSRG
jgi:hypothetical protein